MSGEYVVEIKPSARRTNGAVGQLVNSDGTRHSFPDREAAETWAKRLAVRGFRTVWIRRANPNDADDVDAYLMGRRSPPPDGNHGDHLVPEGASQVAIEEIESDRSGEKRDGMEASNDQQSLDST